MLNEFVKQSPLLRERLGALSIHYGPGPSLFTEKPKEAQITWRRWASILQKGDIP